jgi:predicted nucleic acid-binding protein
VIIADTGAVIALVDADDRHHAAMRMLFESSADEWVLPWAILPEVDYLLAARVGVPAQLAFVEDLASGAFVVEWGDHTDVRRASQLCTLYADLRMGLVDGVVMGMAERLNAAAIATFDLRHFGAVAIEGRPRLYPRDL